MLRLLSRAWVWLLLPVAIGAFIGGAYGFYYRGGYSPPVSPDLGLQGTPLPTPLLQAFGKVTPGRDGVFLLDKAHRNSFGDGELDRLLARVSESGYSIDILDSLRDLDGKLRRADVFAVMVPNRGYSEEEVDLVNEFVRKGGRLLLVGDPTLRHDLNSLSEAFGILFRDDFLYNVVEHEGIYRNVYVRNFTPHPVTEGLQEIALYSAGSIKASGPVLAFSDENTYSSLIDRVEPFSPLVGSEDGNVVGVSDLTFFTAPENAVSDNDLLIANLASYLTAGQRTRDLADFPHFFKGDVDILLGNPELFPIGTDLKAVLAAFQTSSEMRPVEDITRDTVFLGTYNDADDVAHYLAIAGVQVGDTLRAPFTADIEIRGTAIVLLQQDARRNVLVVLGSTDGVVGEMVRVLGNGQFLAGLVGDFLGVYRLF